MPVECPKCHSKNNETASLNVRKMYDLNEREDVLYITMEYVASRDLSGG
jgi:hypothetical protein